MADRYPRRYLTIDGDKIGRVIVKDAAQEAAVILNYKGILGLNEPELFDDKSLRVPDTPPESE